VEYLFPVACTCRITFNLSSGDVAVLETAPATPPENRASEVLISDSFAPYLAVADDEEEDEEDEEEDEDDSLSAPKVNNIKKRRTGETNGKSNNDVDAEGEDVHDEDDEEDDEDDEGDEEEVADEEDDEEDEDE